MEHNLDNLKLKDLQEICIKYNLKTYGKKSDIVKRIREHEIAQIEKIEVALTATASNTNEDDDSINLELDNEESENFFMRRLMFLINLGRWLMIFYIRVKVLLRKGKMFL